MKSIAELRDEIKEKITTDNIVEAIIFKVYKPLKGLIPKSQIFLQTVFLKMKKKCPSLFRDFIFDESGITPFSDELDSVLFRLETSTILHTLNPSYKNYTITDSLKVLEASYKKLRSKKAEIDKCAEIFSEMAMKQAK